MIDHDKFIKDYEAFANRTIEEMVAALTGNDHATLRARVKGFAKRLNNAILQSEHIERKHVFTPSDIHPDTCSMCGKYQSYKGSGH